MQLSDAIKGRRSIRCFKSQHVSDKLIREILEDARWAPSWGNTQPWEFYVLIGEPLERFKEANRSLRMQRVKPSPEIPMPKLWPMALKNRSANLGSTVLSSIGIEREDLEARERYYGDMFALFGAPCLVLTCINRALRIEYAMLDVGLVSLTICLLAHSKGLGSCMLAASVSYPKLLRELLPIPEDRLIVIGIALGYPDWEVPVNHLTRERAPLYELLRRIC